MKKIIVLTFLLLGGVIAWNLYEPTPPMSSAKAAEEGHGDHDDHGKEEKPEHDDDDDHGQEKEGHGHGEGAGHEEHEEEEGRTKITPEAAKAAGIKVSVAGQAMIQDVLTLTGRIVLNRNTTSDVRARFPGVVRSVKVQLGEKIKKGQVLAAVESNDSLKSYNIVAPTDGVLLSRNTNIGNVAGDDPLFTIAQLSDVWAEFHVFPRDLGKVEEGQQVRVHTLENTKEIEAPITLILPTADAISQTVIAVVTIPNKDGKWRPGMTVEGDVHISEMQVPVAVLESALQRTENKDVLFVQEGDGYEMRHVKLGKSDGKYVEIREGLKQGEKYVSEGSFIVKADIGKAAAGHDH